MRKDREGYFRYREQQKLRGTREGRTLGGHRKLLAQLVGEFVGRALRVRKARGQAKAWVRSGGRHRCGCCLTPSGAPKGQGRPCLNVKNRPLFQCSRALRKHAYCLLGPRSLLGQKKENRVGTGQRHGSWCDSLCKAECVKRIRVILPKLFSGISGHPRVSDLIPQRPLHRCSVPA